MATADIDEQFINNSATRITVDIALSTVIAGVALTSLVLLLILWKRDDNIKRHAYSFCEWISLGLCISIIVRDGSAIPNYPEDSKPGDFRSNYRVSLIGALVMISLLLLLDVVALILHNMYVCRRDREAAPSITKGYAVHIAFFSVAMALSAAVAIWYMVVGEELKDHNISFWTWEVFLIAFFVSIVGTVIIAVIVYFACIRK